MKKIFYLSLILVSGLISACKKDKKPDNNGGTTVDANTLKDSVYYYEKEDYLWSDAIPSYSSFNPHGYSASSTFNALSNEIAAISQLKINPATGKPYEYSPDDPGYPKYSFIDDGTTTASLNGTNGDFGFEPLYIASNDLRVKYVYAGSPADSAGLKRGYQITSINGNTTLTYDNGPNVNFVINAIYYSANIKLGIKKPDGTTATVTLNTNKYTVNPVLTYKVFDEGNGHKIGYVAFNSFTSITNAKPKLNAAFNSFISSGVTELVVDLRYNGGGDAETAEYLDNLIVPNAKSKTLMYTQFFNSNLTGGNSPLFDKKFGTNKESFQPENNQATFSKQLSLEVGRVFFIVTGATASSSELTINNLKPEMNVQLVGDTTYGKPVGEYPITLGTSKFSIWSPQVYVKNSANQGDYYPGMAPGSALYPGKLAADDVTKDFGDPTEGLLAEVINYVNTGSYALIKPQVQSLQPGKQLFSIAQQRSVFRKLDQHKFKPMVLKRAR
jgi:C-terminal processing protease CtpA/Prc